MSGKYALIIGNTDYSDPGLAKLSAPGKDAEDFARVLQDKEIGAFDNVKVIVNQTSAAVIEAIDEFFDQKKPDDMLVFYFSGHGIRDGAGSLYLAFMNTIRSRLRSTAIKSEYIREAMDQSRSKRQVLILDCCNSGAFPQGTKAELGGSMGMTRAFQGYGRFVLTASDATQFAWEGDKVIGETDNSLFTHFLVKGLEGEADNDGDGRITVDELYDYAYDQISRVTPNQTPTKSSSKVEGEIVLRQSTRIEDIKPVALPDDLISEIEDLRPLVREGAVQRLEKILRGKNIGMMRSALGALEKIVSDENTTRRVSQIATQVLEAYHQVEKKTEEDRKAKGEAERIAIQKVEEERLAREKAEAEQKAKEETERLQRAQAQREAAEREAAQIKAEREAAERAANEKAEKEIAERIAAHKAEREAMDLAAHKKAEREALELAARRKAEREAKEKVRSAPEKISPQQTIQRQRPILKWIIIGLIGVCIFGGCTWRIYSYLVGLPAPTLAPTNPVVEQTSAPIVPNTEMDVLIAAAQEEGTLTLIALPHDWCNYGGVIDAFKAKYPNISVNELNPDAGSGDEVEAIKANKDNKGPQAPDVIDVGFAFGPSSKAENLLMPYKVATWDDIPVEVKDPDGYWYGDYYGVLSFLVDIDVQPNVPQDWADLLKPEYKDQVALSGDPRTSNQAIQTVFAAALASGGSLDNAQPGLDFFAQLNSSGNLVPLIANNGLVAKGETPIRITWDYNALSAVDSFAGNPNAKVVIPATGRFAGVYVQAISAYAPHPNAAKLWMEFLYSDEGQLLWMRGYCHPILEDRMLGRGVIPADLLTKMPNVSGAVFPTLDQLNAAKELISTNWDSIVGADIQPAP